MSNIALCRFVYHSIIFDSTTDRHYVFICCCWFPGLPLRDNFGKVRRVNRKWGDVPRVWKVGELAAAGKISEINELFITKFSIISLLPLSYSLRGSSYSSTFHSTQQWINCRKHCHARQKISVASLSCSLLSSWPTHSWDFSFLAHRSKTSGWSSFPVALITLFTSEFEKCLYTLFRIILGDFNFHQLEDAHRALGPTFFISWVKLERPTKLD